VIVYYVKVRLGQEVHRHATDAGFTEDPFDSEYSDPTNPFAVNRLRDAPLSCVQLFLRRGCSFLMFLIILSSYGYIQYEITKRTDETSDELTAVGLGSILMVVRILWSLACWVLTLFEGHVFENDFTRWYCLKLFVFDLLASGLIDIVDRITSGRLNNQCELMTLGQKRLILMVIDMTLTNVGDLFYPVLYNFVMRRFAERSSEGDNDFRYSFDLAEQYTEVIFRQFTILLGTSLIPILPLLGAINSFVTYWLDRYKLLRLSAVPIKSRSAYSKMLTIFMTINLVVSWLFFPTGLLWLWQGSTYFPDCNFFSST
jgi:hypothetical protein